MKNKDRFVHKFIEKLSQLDLRYIENYLLRLDKERHFLEDLVNLLDEGIIVLDSEKNILLINTTALQLLHIKDEQVIGKPVYKFLYDERLQIFFEKVWDINDQSINTEITLEPPRQMILGVNIVTYIYPGEEHLKTKIFVFNDITDRKMKMEELLQHEKLNTYSLLSAGVAHEIGNPLNSLNIHLQLLANEIKGLDVPQKNDLSELVHVAREEITRIDSIIKRFLKSIRPFQLKLNEHNITDTLNQTIELLSQEMKVSNISVSRDFSKNFLPFLYDQELIIQAFINIIKNALQAMPDGGKLLFSVKALKDGYCKIAISDTGKGIPKSIVKKIFDPYFTTRHDGTGLGLMIVSRIVSAHAGEISILSKEQEGTTIIIKLPMRRLGQHMLPKSKEN